MPYVLYIAVLLCLATGQLSAQDSRAFIRVKDLLKKDILTRAEWALQQQPITVTAVTCERSAGGIHDFYSEGDYWWPNPDAPDGPYIQRDGLSNPGNFTAHRKAMIRFSQVMGYLGSAYLITGNNKYAAHAFRHLRAWFVDTATRMNPSLMYAQAIKGKVTGRAVGIIDLIQMMEVAQAVRVFETAPAADRDMVGKVKAWFADYLQWVTTHPYGLEERDAKNNHGTCWVMQVAVFAQLTGNQALLNDCRARFKMVLLPNQMDERGAFPLELKRTKPYGYSLFNLDAMTILCYVLSGGQEDLWTYSTLDGRSMRKGIAFMYPFVKDKSAWTYPADVMYWENWPVAQPFLLFGYERFGQKAWYRTWKRLDHFPETEEVIRNLPVRNPLIWLAS